MPEVYSTASPASKRNRHLPPMYIITLPSGKANPLYKPSAQRRADAALARANVPTLRRARNEHGATQSGAGMRISVSDAGAAEGSEAARGNANAGRIAEAASAAEQSGAYTKRSSSPLRSAPQKNASSAGTIRMTMTTRSRRIIGMRSFVPASSPRIFALFFLSSKARSASFRKSRAIPSPPFIRF